MNKICSFCENAHASPTGVCTVRMKVNSVTSQIKSRLFKICVLLQVFTAVSAFTVRFFFFLFVFAVFPNTRIFFFRDPNRNEILHRSRTRTTRTRIQNHPVVVHLSRTGDRIKSMYNVRFG